MGCEGSKATYKTINNDTNGNDQNQKSNNNVDINKTEQISPPSTARKTPLSDDEMRSKINRYIEIEKDIYEWESQNLQEALNAKKKHADEVAEALKNMEQQYRTACEKVIKNKADVDKMQNPNIKAFFKNQQEYEEKMAKEQEEYLEAIREQEVVKKELEDIQMQAKISAKEVMELTNETNKLIILYDEQDQILDDIFGGKYGSNLENKLEFEVDELLDRKERIGVAKYKWINGRLLLQHAHNQLGHAVSRWQSLAQGISSNVQVRYQLATETRNNLIAASQNIMNAKKYLNNIKFPYCESEEMSTLDKACDNVYVDMKSPDRHQHALQCYNVTHRRTSALVQWFDNVINQTIDKDLKKVKAELTLKQAELRKERLRLMNEKIGGSSNIIKISDKDVFDEFDDDVLEPELVAISKPEKVEGKSGFFRVSSDSQIMALTPLPLSELAPPPSQEDLFGHIELLKKQHEHDIAHIEKVRETSKTRMEQRLQEKLRQRRIQRKRMIEE